MSDNSSENTPVQLKYDKITTDEGIESVYNFNVNIFSELAGTQWSIKAIKQEIKDGWELYAAKAGDEIIAAVFIRKEKDGLHTKHTPIKIEHRGNAYSHRIKEFCERKARESGVSSIYNICEVDNFRMISLNETHGYERTDRKIGSGTHIEWIKKIVVKK